MAINAERLYENACEALRRACVAVHDKDEEAGNGLYKMMVKDPELYLHASDRIYWYEALPALEIYLMAKDEIGKAKGGTAYSAVKRIVKINKDAGRKAYAGAWTDADGMFCVCSGYHGVRLKKPIDGFETVEGFDLKKAIPSDDMIACELKLPTPGELKISATKHTKYPYSKVYDFGDGLPLVNAKYLKDMMDCLPDARAYATYSPYSEEKGVECYPIVFKSDKGDGILLPIRKMTA